MSDIALDYWVAAVRLCCRAPVSDANAKAVSQRRPTIRAVATIVRDRGASSDRWTVVVASVSGANSKRYLTETADNRGVTILHRIETDTASRPGR